MRTLTRTRSALVAVVLVAAAGTLTACGGDDETAADAPASQAPSSEPTASEEAPPAICADVEALTASMASLGDIGLGKGTVAKVQAEIDTIKDVADNLRANAGEEFGDQADAVADAYTAVTDSLAAAVDAPSAAALGDVSTAVTELVTQVQTLASDVTSAC